MLFSVFFFSSRRRHTRWPRDWSSDVCSSDLVMPQMSGRRFADWLRSASPHIKVVFVSGYLEESLHPGDRRDPGMFFLPKPFDSEQLAAKVREALDKL